MSGRGTGSPGESARMQTPILKVSLRAARSALSEMIEDGRDLERQVAVVAYAEERPRRVLEWQRRCGRWLDENIGGHAAEEFTASVADIKDYAWMGAYWSEYGGIRKNDLRSEVAVLESIFRRLADWAEFERAEPKGVAAMRDAKAVMVVYGHDQEAKG